MRDTSQIIQEILLRRGIAASEREEFLHPDFSKNNHDPLKMKGMAAAVERLARAVKEKEKIVIFGDYDADGVPATALLCRALNRLGLAPIGMIPNRVAGYGLNKDVVEEIIATKAKLLITVDNGIVAKDEVAMLLKAGFEVIITDHHNPDPERPVEGAVAVLDPKQEDCSYPFKELCGCAIAWKLAWALYEKLAVSTDPLKWELDLVAVSTVADMVPLRGENRLLTIYGLKVLRKTRNLGLKALIGAARVDPEKVGAGDLGFKIGPRLNAPSRMHAEELDLQNAPLELLITEDVAKAGRLAEYLNKMNEERQSLLEEHLTQAEAMLSEYQDDLAYILYNSGWSSGIVGLLAGKLMDRYHRPVIALAKEGEVVKGSMRSLEGVNAVAMLQDLRELLTRFGGHPKAAGLTLKGEVDVFRTAVLGWLKANKVDLEKLRELSATSPDIEVSLQEADLDLAKALGELEPYGVGFASPLLAAKVQVMNLKTVGKQGQHLSCMLKNGQVVRKAVGFGMGYRLEELQGLGDVPVKVIFNLDREVWQDVEYASCRIKLLDC